VKYPTSGVKQVFENDFEVYGRQSGYFRSPAPYVAKNGRKPASTVSADEQKKLDARDRYCLNWACTKAYKQQSNHKKACLCHPGKWDFGYSG
jgi:hypothetical protein